MESRQLITVKNIMDGHFNCPPFALAIEHSTGQLFRSPLNAKRTDSHLTLLSIHHPLLVTASSTDQPRAPPALPRENWFDSR